MNTVLNRWTRIPFQAALIGLAVAAPPILADEGSALPDEPEERTAAAESVQGDVEKKAADEALEKRRRIMTEATTAIKETQKALTALDEEKTDEALQALEVATGKLELILARDPDLALAPVDVAMVTYDLLADLDTVKEAIEQAAEYIEDGEIQKARPLVANLASEIVFRTTNIPLATYPDAIKAVVPLIDAGETAKAKRALMAALNTLVVTTDQVIPLPVLRAERLLEDAEALAENDERTIKDNDTLAELLAEARKQLEMAELLGYGDKGSYEAMYEQLSTIEAKTSGGKSGEGWFDRIKSQLSKLL